MVTPTLRQRQTGPNEWHWHEATSEQFMVHLAFTEGHTEWGDHLADAERPFTDAPRRSADLVRTNGDLPEADRPLPRLISGASQSRDRILSPAR